MATLRPRLLIVADGVVPTGFSRVAGEIAAGLIRDFEVHHLALNYYGRRIRGPVTIHPVARKDSFSGAATLRRLMRRVQPHIVLMINDLWVAREYRDILRDRKARTILYTPIDSGPIEPELALPLCGIVDQWVYYTSFGATQMAQAAADSGEHSPLRVRATITPVF